MYRHLASLRQLGLIEQDSQTEKYRLGAKLVIYGQAASEQFDLRAIADPYLTRLRDATGQSAMVSVATNGAALVVASADSLSNICISVKPGNRVMAHCSAQGRVILAFSDATTEARLLKGDLPSYTQHSLVSPEAIAQRLALIRERLWDVADSEVTLGISALAAPIFRDESTVAGTIGIVGTNVDIPPVPPAVLIEEVQAVAAEISERLNNHTYAKTIAPQSQRRKG
jgi:DNA-binding IclR family transcriptional regulator